MGAGERGGERVAVVVAHPDDETLWAGGTLLLHPEWRVIIATLCRASDLDRAPRFQAAARRLGAVGRMADLEDGPEQRPLPEGEVAATVMGLVGDREYDLVITHGPRGEYTRHLRHEETSRAVVSLWERGRLRSQRLWLFAYEDGGGAYLPRAVAEAPIRTALPEEVWGEKYRILREVYGFAGDSKEARTTPREEGFWVGSRGWGLGASEGRGGIVDCRLQIADYRVAEGRVEGRGWRVESREVIGRKGRGEGSGVQG